VLITREPAPVVEHKNSARCMPIRPSGKLKPLLSEALAAAGLPLIFVPGAAHSASPPTSTATTSDSPLWMT